MELFNKNGVLNRDTETDKLLDGMHRQWKEHCFKLFREGVTSVEMRALESLAMGAISTASAEAQLWNALDVRKKAKANENL